jgi:hypothetical protein
VLTIMTWFWTQPGGRTFYTIDHVNIWARMMRRHLSIPHELACVTDLPEGIDRRVRVITPPRDFETWQIPTWGFDKPQCLRRLSLFSPRAAEIFGATRFVSMDLDCLVLGSLDSLFDHDDDFRMYKGTSSTRAYNGSMIQMTAGARANVYTSLTYEAAVAAGEVYIGSDQAWIASCLGPNEKVWSESDGVYRYSARFQQDVRKKTPRLVFFPGKVKPWDVIALDRNVRQNYR